MALGRRMCAVAAACAALLAGGGAFALDTLELKDGRTLQGWVLSEAGGNVEFEAHVGKIRSVMKFRKAEIKKLTKDPNRPAQGEQPAAEQPVEAPAEESAAPERTAPEAPAKAQAAGGAGQKRFMVVPLKGEFGKEITAEGVKDALRHAARSGVSEIVFELDSPGGLVMDANGIVAAMKEFDDKLRYHAVIDRAISASIWVVSFCDTVWVKEGSATGAAVAFTMDVETGAAAVDAKMLSALAAEIAANAEKRGHPGDVFRAMIQPEAELHRWDENGEVRVGAKAPAGVKDAKQLDNSTSVLTLTSAEMVDIGIARWMKAGDDVGALVDGSPWRAAGEYGTSAMKRAADKREKSREELEGLAKRIDELVPAVNRAIEYATTRDPMAVQQYYVDSATGFFTAQSAQDWKKNTRAALEAWDTAIAAMRELEGSMRKYEKITGERPVTTMNMKEVAAQIDREIRKLRENEGKNRV